VHVWDVYRAYGCAGPALDARFAAEPRGEEARALKRLLQPWRAGFPDVSVTEEIVPGRVMEGLLDVARAADLLIVGRRRSHALAMHIGPVTHGLVHHAECPIAVVSHD
jgi:nucleotide-binding universal stress UspA family protein